MIHLTANTKILLATQPADFRQGIDGLAAVCKQRLSEQKYALDLHSIVAITDLRGMTWSIKFSHPS